MRIESQATLWSIRGPEAVEHLRNTGLDEMYKEDPEKASFYDDALECYDERARVAQANAVAPPEAGAAAQNHDMASPEDEASQSDSTIPDPEVQAASEDNNIAPSDMEAASALMNLRYGPAELEAASALMSLRYGGSAQQYIGHGATDTSMGLRPFDSAVVQIDAITATSQKVMPCDGIFEALPLSAPLAPIHNHQSSEIARPSTRRQGKQPVDHLLSTPHHSSAFQPAGSTKATNSVGPAIKGFRFTQPSLVKNKLSKTLEQSTTVRRSKRKSTHTSESDNNPSDYDRSTSIKKPRTSREEKSGEQSPMLLRSNRKVIRIEDDESNDSEDQFEALSTKIKSLTGSKKAKSDETTKNSPMLRRTKRKLTRIDEDEEADFSLPDEDLRTPKRSKRVVKKVKTTPVDGDVNAASPDKDRRTLRNSKKLVSKSVKTSTEEDEDDEEDEVQIVKKPTQASKRSSLALFHPPTNLPLKAPDNTPCIPNGALALNEHFKKDEPRPLGVQLPVDRARTRWEWVQYNSRKVANANFNWADEQQRKDANRFRQQRIRRRLTEHGYIHDGRKNH